ncbi:hypothetical protein AB1484_34490 [Parafrankia sp. FMc6]|uniref:hypothetical protein n=1 Tax=Parafrankia soli TaxID=2599596 RepID=UPI0034D4DE45
MIADPVPATADTIERAFGIPASTIRRYASEGAVQSLGGRPARYDTRAVLAVRARRLDRSTTG